MTTHVRPDGALPYHMRKVLNRLSAFDTLSADEAREVLLGITGGLVNEAQIISFISTFMMRQPTIDELSGFRLALLEQSVGLPMDASGAIDIVGTGGDGKNTFNISTLSAFVVAGAGYQVVKHGNYAASSISGSSNVLEYLGYRFTNDAVVLSRQLDQSGICFLHAPLFHPVMKKLGDIRRNLGVRTFFNLLGPLTNPLQPGYQLLGVNSLRTARMYHYLLQASVGKRYMVVHAVDGYDEVSLTGPVRVYGDHCDRLIDVAELGFDPVTPEAIEGGNTVKNAARIFMNVLTGCATVAQRHVVLANSGFALQVLHPNYTFSDCVALAVASLDSGKALQSFQSALQIK